MVESKNKKLLEWGSIEVYNYISYVTNIACSPSSKD